MQFEMARKKRCCINVKDVASESEDKECGINCGFILFYFFCKNHFHIGFQFKPGLYRNVY